MSSPAAQRRAACPGRLQFLARAPAALQRPARVPAPRGARRGGAGGLVCASEPVAARPAVPGPAHVAVAGRDATHEAARLGFAFTTAHLHRRDLLVVLPAFHVLGQAPIWLASCFLNAGKRLPRSWASTTPPWATASTAGCPHTGRCAGSCDRCRPPGCWSWNAVARLRIFPSAEFLVAVTRLLAERHLAGRLRAARRSLWHQRAAPGVRRCTPHAAARHAARAHPGSERAGAHLGSAWRGSLLSRLDHARGAGSFGGGHPGGNPAGREVAGEQPRHHASSSTSPYHRAGTGHPL